MSGHTLALDLAPASNRDIISQSLICDTARPPYRDMPPLMGMACGVGKTGAIPHEDIRFFCGLSETNWNRLEPAPGRDICISPINGKTDKRETTPLVLTGSRVLSDSGAFSDSPKQRLTPNKALKHQMDHAQKYHYADKIALLGTYDLLIDETWNDDVRTKRRWTLPDAEQAVTETVQNARWLDKHRTGIPLVLSAQGVDAHQYLLCVEMLVDSFQASDALGLGGWCVVGRIPAQMMTTFRQTMDLVLPFIASQGIDKVHIWGVIFPPALSYLLHVAEQYHISVSTDSTGPKLYPVFGKWGYGSWRDAGYKQKRPSGVALGLDRIRHVRFTRDWLNTFHESLDFAEEMAILTGSVWRETISGRMTITRESVTLPVCVVCGEQLTGRSHRLTCGDRCRKRLSRRAEQ